MQPQKPEVHDKTETARKTIWNEGRLGFTLALLSGYLDAYAYLNYKIYVSFLSGNTTQTGLQLGEWHLEKAWHGFIPILAFVIGVFAGTMLLHSAVSQPILWLFAAVRGFAGERHRRRLRRRIAGMVWNRASGRGGGRRKHNRQQSRRAVGRSRLCYRHFE